MQQLKTEQYKGYPIKFVEKMIGSNKIVIGEFPSKVTKKVMGDHGVTKDVVLTKCKKLIDKEYKLFNR